VVVTAADVVVTEGVDALEALIFDRVCLYKIQASNTSYLQLVLRCGGRRPTRDMFGSDIPSQP
jgi:hypothetical protein